MTRLVRHNSGRGHWYDVDGRKVDGVTTAISTGFPLNLKQWAADTAANYAIEHWAELSEEPLTKRLDRMRYAHRERLSAAALRGTEIHAYGEQLVHGGDVEIPDEYRGPSEAYAKFLDEWEIEPIATETPVANTEYGYAGTADLWATIGARGGEPALVDLKTGKRVYESVALQLAAYRNATLWQHDDTEDENVPLVESVYVAHVLADAVELVPVRADAQAFRTFLYVLSTSRWINAHGWKGDDPVIGAATTFGVAS